MKKLLFVFGLVLMICLAVGMACAEQTFEGVTVPDGAELVDFGDTVVQDLQGLADFLGKLPNLRQVDMYANQMKKADCDALAERFPNVRWGWTLVIQARDHKHLIRTDTTAFSTLHNNKSTPHKSEDFEILKYCWNLKALDVGHNEVKSIEFLRDLPDIRVLILACNYITDIAPLADLKKLEYLEIFKNRVEDLTPLSGLNHLLDLNICFNRVHDWTPLTSLKQLMRLWCYRSGWFYINQEIPKDVVRMLKDALPDTEVDSIHYSTAGTWRELSKKKLHPHYEVITHIFGADSKHPGTGYEPFAESFPDEETAETEPAVPAAEPAGTPDEDLSEIAVPAQAINTPSAGSVGLPPLQESQGN